MNTEKHFVKHSFKCWIGSDTAMEIEMIWTAVEQQLIPCIKVIVVRKPKGYLFIRYYN